MNEDTSARDMKIHSVRKVAIIAGKSLDQWVEFARRDDCLDRMVPSDLRLLIGALRKSYQHPNRSPYALCAAMDNASVSDTASASTACPSMGAHPEQAWLFVRGPTISQAVTSSASVSSIGIDFIAEFLSFLRALFGLVPDLVRALFPALVAFLEAIAEERGDNGSENAKRHGQIAEKVKHHVAHPYRLAMP